MNILGCLDRPTLGHYYLDGVDTVEEQIAIAKRKAGIGEPEQVELERFEVVRHF